jgi:ribosomal protein S6
MKEKDVENHFVWVVERLGGKTYKFNSLGRKGVADRIACLPDGSTWFVELKTKGGRLSELQKLFAFDMARLNQRYVCIWTKEQIDEIFTRNI